MRSKRNLLGGRAAPLCVTGIGLVTAAGRGVAALGRALDERRSALRPLGFDGRSHGGQVDLESRDPAGRASTLARLALEEALDEAFARGRPRGRLRLSVGTALGDVDRLEELVANAGPLAHKAGSGQGTADPPYGFERFAAALTARAASACGGATAGAALTENGNSPPAVFSVTCVSGLCALEQAAADLAFDRADVVLVGGVDGLTRFMHGGFSALGALSRSDRLRPFDVEHDGILIGEAAAFAVVEPLRLARERGDSPAACVVSQRLVSDAAHLTSPDAEGRGMARAIAGALEDAGLNADDVGLVTVTAAGSAVHDRMQSRALHSALGARAGVVPVTTWEPAVGHVLAATGVLGIIHACMVLAEGRSWATFGARNIDPECRLRYALDGPVPLERPCVLALTVGFGGQNGATVLTSSELALDLCGRARERAA